MEIEGGCVLCDISWDNVKLVSTSVSKVVEHGPIEQPQKADWGSIVNTELSLISIPVPKGISSSSLQPCFLNPDFVQENNCSYHLQTSISIL